MRFLILSSLLLLSACGYDQRDAEGVGQIKKVTNATPMLCPDFHAVDISLGVMRNGVGSMSTEDTWLLVKDDSMLKTITTASESGKIVKFKYDSKRFAFCTPDRVLNSIQVLDN